MLPDIEGEFRSEEDGQGRASGYYCLRCKTALLTGQDVCGGCGRDFPKPTLSLGAVARLRIEYRPQYTLGRTTAKEMEWSRLYNLNRRF